MLMQQIMWNKGYESYFRTFIHAQILYAQNTALLLRSNYLQAKNKHFSIRFGYSAMVYCLNYREAT